MSIILCLSQTPQPGQEQRRGNTCLYIKTRQRRPGS
nr:MAG TPA: hypothetical protein [Caudoviricetes sp.]